jgi:hypothetical protein
MRSEVIECDEIITNLNHNEFVSRSVNNNWPVLCYIGRNKLDQSANAGVS